MTWKIAETRFIERRLGTIDDVHTCNEMCGFLSRTVRGRSHSSNGWDDMTRKVMVKGMR